MRAIWVVCFLCLAACAPRGAIAILDPARASAIVQPVFVATNRDALPSDGEVAGDFGSNRRQNLRFERFDLSIPANHETGQIEWPQGRRIDPARHMVGVGGAFYPDAQAFVRALAREGQGRDVVLTVHGYNNNFAETVYRWGQVAHDYDIAAPMVVFAWPSAGKAQGYVYDRDSVTFSRDALEALLVALQRDGGFDVQVIAHSLGGQLVMEVLRQMEIGGLGRYVQGLNGVVLISPDIDKDVFLQQVRRIDPLPQPFVVMTSQRDRILELSARLSGKPTRLGAIGDPSDLAGLPIQVIDLTSFEGGDLGGHTTALTSPAAIEALRRLQTQ